MLSRSDARTWKTVGIGGNYSTLAAWENFCSTSRLGGAQTALCLDVAGTNNLGDLTVASWTCPPSNNFEAVITPQTGHGHSWTTNGTGAICGTVNLAYGDIWIQGMRAKRIGVVTDISVARVRIERNVVRSADAGTTPAISVSATSSGIVHTNILIRYNLVADCTNYAGIYVFAAGGPVQKRAHAVIVGNSVIRCGKAAFPGIGVGANSASGIAGKTCAYETNNVVGDPSAGGSCIAQVGTVAPVIWSRDYDISSDATATGTHSASNVTMVSVFADKRKDFRPIPSGSAYGTGLSTPTLTDLLNRSLPVGRNQDKGAIGKFLVNPCP